MIYGKKLFSKLRAYVKEKNEEDYDHGELSIGNPMEHVKMLKMWMENGMVPGSCNE